MINICTPALFYFILAIVSTSMMIVQKATAISIIINIIFVIGWTWLLNFVCRKGFTPVSWMLVLSPYVIVFIALMTGVISMADIQVEQEKQLQQQQQQQQQQQ